MPLGPTSALGGWFGADHQDKSCYFGYLTITLQANKHPETEGRLKSKTWRAINVRVLVADTRCMMFYVV